MSEVSAEEFKRLESEMIANRHLLQDIKEQLDRFEQAIGSFVGGMQAAAQGGGMTGMLARAVMPEPQPSNKPRLGG